MEWVTDITGAITGSLTQIGTAMFNFLKTGFTTLFLETSEQGAVTGVSNFGKFSFIIMGISLALGVTYFIVNLVRKHR